MLVDESVIQYAIYLRFQSLYEYYASFLVKNHTVRE